MSSRRKTPGRIAELAPASPCGQSRNSVPSRCQRFIRSQDPSELSLHFAMHGRSTLRLYPGQHDSSSTEEFRGTQYSRFCRHDYLMEKRKRRKREKANEVRPQLPRPLRARLSLMSVRRADAGCNGRTARVSAASWCTSYAVTQPTTLFVRSLSSSNPLYLIPTTIESGPARCSTMVFRKPAFFIHTLQSAPE